MKKMMRALVTFLTLCSLIASQAAALRAEENQGLWLFAYAVLRFRSLY